MSTTLQRILSGQAVEKAVRQTRPRKESGKTPSDATVENLPPSEAQDVRKAAAKRTKQGKSAANKAANKAKQRAKAEIFVREYVNNGFNATDAYQVIAPRAKRKSCQTRGPLMLADIVVQQILASYMLSLREKYEVDHQFVWRGWVAYAGANVMHYFEQGPDNRLRLRDLESLPPDVQRNIRKVKVTRTIVESDGDETVYNESIDLQLVDPQKALDSMARALRMFDGEGGSAGEGGIADLIRGGVARIKNMGDLNAHKIVSEQ